jgi:hypothetical protein
VKLSPTLCYIATPPQLHLHGIDYYKTYREADVRFWSVMPEDLYSWLRFELVKMKAAEPILGTTHGVVEDIWHQHECESYHENCTVECFISALQIYKERGLK